MTLAHAIEILDHMPLPMLKHGDIHEIISVDCEEDEHDLCLSVFAGMLMPGSYRCTCTCHV